jgi:hypothetical protein
MFERINFRRAIDPCSQKKVRENRNSKFIGEFKIKEVPKYLKVKFFYRARGPFDSQVELCIYQNKKKSSCIGLLEGGALSLIPKVICER